MTPVKNGKVNSRDIDKELQQVDKLFADLAKDKTLPTFGGHLMTCMMLGTAECVNLKKMYPKPYEKLSKWLAAHEKHLNERK
jgi:hypothetical protein